MSDTRQSTPPIYEEEWEVLTTSKRKYILDEKQMKVLRESMEEGNRGMIFFKDFAFSIAHVVEINLLSKRIKNQLPDHIDNELTEEELERVVEKMAQFKKDFFGKHKMAKTRMSQKEVEKRKKELNEQAENLKN